MVTSVFKLHNAIPRYILDCCGVMALLGKEMNDRGLRSGHAVIGFPLRDKEAEAVGVLVPPSAGRQASAGDRSPRTAFASRAGG